VAEQSIRQPEQLPPIAAWIGFVAMCVGMFMAILDIQIVATSLPTIQAALRIRPEQMSWIQTSYLIAEVISISLTGFLTRMLSLRGLFIVAVAIFVAASAGCAGSRTFEILIVWRTIQGFAGGALIPVVFSAMVLLFPNRGQTLATTIAGALAVLAPTLGPIGGGWITSMYSWRWLFLINIGPGLASALVGYAFLPRTRASLSEARTLDVLSLCLLVATLTTLELGLKDAPELGWRSERVAGLFALAVSSGAFFAFRTLSKSRPIVDLTVLGDRNFALGSALSFILGIGLYGSVYLMPIFLAYVRGHEALEIGKIMLVTGAAQLISTPIAVWLDKRLSGRLLTGFGFALLSVGLFMSAFDTPRTDYENMYLPQAVRGFSIMFCLLPPTRIALGYLPADRVPNGSAIFNLMRNLGGAIGLALIDTVVFGRAEGHGRELTERLLRGEGDAFSFVGLPPLSMDMKFTAEMVPLINPAIKTAALTIGIAEAWTMVSVLTAVGVVLSIMARRDVDDEIVAA
jgi:MFS transporter, DHA2 family, multidrug resistance protein